MIGAFIFCDRCGYADFYHLTNKTEIVRISRRKGWSIGKRHLCPECRKNKKTGGGRLVIKAELLPMQKEEQRHEEE